MVQRTIKVTELRNGDHFKPDNNSPTYILSKKTIVKNENGRNTGRRSLSVYIQNMRHQYYMLINSTDKVILLRRPLENITSRHQNRFV
jgi:hypothetical protein